MNTKETLLKVDNMSKYFLVKKGVLSKSHKIGRAHV